MTPQSGTTASFESTQDAAPEEHARPSTVFQAPADDDEVDADDENAADARTVQTRPLRVLIVEDEAIVAMELEMLLEDLGAEVVGIAMSAAEADALVSTHLPDVVTMDINIKGDRDGVSAAQGIFQRHGIRPIFISAYSDLATRRRAETCRPIAWIEKPIDPVDLAGAVSQLHQV